MMRPPSSLTTYKLEAQSGPGATTQNNLSYFAAAQGIMSLGSAWSQGRVAEAQYNYQAQQIEANIRLSEIQADDAIRRGKVEASKMDQMTKKVIGSQRANFAGQNVDVNQGSAMDIQAETAAQGAENSLAIENNAWREAWGYRVQAVSGQAQAVQTRAAANNVMGNTLLTGGLQAANYGANAYYMSNKNNKTGEA